MAKQHIKYDEACPVARSVNLVGDRWSLLIVRNAFDGTRRFGDFQRDLGVARSILADRLRDLVEAGIFEVKPASDGTSYQEYVLTLKGEELFPLIVALRQWGEHHLYKKGEMHSQLLDTKSGKPLVPMKPHTKDGRSVTSKETKVKKIS